MAKVKIEKRCGGPMNWETINGHRKLVPLGICCETVSLEYDDSVDLEAMVGRIFEHGVVHCDKCAKDGNRMINARDERLRKMYDQKHGYAEKSQKETRKTTKPQLEF